VKIEFNFDARGNLIGGDYQVNTRREDNLLTYIRGKALDHNWQYTPSNSYKIAHRGITREIEFINHHWYWISWDDDQNNSAGCYTVNPAYDYIIAPKEYRLGTEEDHY